MLHLPVANTRTGNSFVIYCVLPTAPIIFAPVAWYHILLVANPINRYLIKKRVNPFVSRAVPRAQRKQTMRIEVRVADCRWQRCAFPNPAQDFRKIARVAAFDGAPTLKIGQLNLSCLEITKQARQEHGIGFGNRFHVVPSLCSDRAQLYSKLRLRLGQITRRAAMAFIARRQPDEMTAPFPSLAARGRLSCRLSPTAR